MPIEDSEEDFTTINKDFVRKKILHLFSVFGPKLSPSMIQVGIGTAVSPHTWHPVLDDLLKEGLLKQTITSRRNPATDRDQSYTIICTPKE